MISIKTKRRNSSDLKPAGVQVGMWHIAQWDFLARLVGRNLLLNSNNNNNNNSGNNSNSDSNGGDGGGEEHQAKPSGTAADVNNNDEVTSTKEFSFTHEKRQELKKRVGELMKELPFLPATLIDGHKWILAATTMQASGRTSDSRAVTLWQVDDAWGSTENLLGVYKTVWGLRRLRRWAMEVF